jgi:C1A family cysteine protease
VVIVGFDAADEAIKFANSWGVGCGTDGFGRMSTKVAEQSQIDMGLGYRPNRCRTAFA